MIFKEMMTLSVKNLVHPIGAIMTKLMHLIFGVLKSGKPFDPNHHRQNQPEPRIS